MCGTNVTKKEEHKMTKKRAYYPRRPLVLERLFAIGAKAAGYGVTNL